MSIFFSSSIFKLKLIFSYHPEFAGKNKHIYSQTIKVGSVHLCRTSPWHQSCLTLLWISAMPIFSLISLSTPNFRFFLLRMFYPYFLLRIFYPNVLPRLFTPDFLPECSTPDLVILDGSPTSFAYVLIHLPD